MRKTKIVLVSVLSILLFIVAGIYISTKIIIPRVLNSATIINKIEKLVYKKTKLHLSIDRINYIGGHLKLTGKVQSEEKIAIFKEITSDVSADFYIYDTRFQGKLTAKNVDAKIALSLIENAPVHFDEAIFYYDGNNLTSNACGTLGEEQACHILRINNAFSPKQEAFGRVKSIITPKSVQYVKGFDVLNNVLIKLHYSIKDDVIDTKYFFYIKKGADIFYKNAYLGSRDTTRKIYISTNKTNDTLKIEKYGYSIAKDNKFKTMISGEGEFTKTNGRFRPKYLSAKTNDYVPSSITNHFNDYISGGNFTGNLEYNFEEKQLTGDFIIKDFSHKDFYVKQAEIKADKDFINILAAGKYLKQNFKCTMRAKNGFGTSGKNIYIYNLDLKLDKYYFKKGGRYKKMSKNASAQDLDLTVENWSIFVGNIIKNRVVLRNVKLEGTLVKNVFKFKSSKVAFAHGTLSASGKHNFNNKISDIDFYASGIDSDTVADLLFNLPGQIKGTANARMRIRAYNGLQSFKAKAAFSIKEGYLPKIGDKKFLLKKGRKFKLSNIIKIKKRKVEPALVNIKGSFSMDNYLIKNIVMTSKQKYLSFILEGDLDLKNDNADLSIFGKYNTKAQKGVKILFVPVKFIMKAIFRTENTYQNYEDKLEKIPDIDTDNGETKYFRVKLNGSPKNNTLKFQMKNII